jgi:hypothetical protein
VSICSDSPCMLVCIQPTELASHRSTTICIATVHPGHCLSSKPCTLLIMFTSPAM